MNTKTKYILSMISGVIALALILWIPALSIVFGAAMLVVLIYKKTKDIPVGIFKKKK